MSLTAPTGCPVSHRAAAFNPFDPAYVEDPAKILAWSRAEEPVFYAPELGYWVVTRYEDVKAVFRDNILFSPANALEKITPAPPAALEILKGYGFAMDRTMVNEDEPTHMERRRLLLDDFLPDALARHEPMVRRLTRDYMDRFIADGRADLVSQWLHDVPLIVALHFLGVPEEGREELRRFTMAHTVNTWGRPTEEEQLKVSENVGKFWATAQRILNEMMADPTGEGWMYETIRQYQKHPDVVTESYLRSMMMAILAAAHETTSNASANMFRLLLSNREVWDAVKANPALIPNTVEECLRLGGSIIAWRRIATAATEINGVAVPEGGKLLIVQASANQDERHFENPDRLDPYRENASDHLSFGYGAHQCMGKNIARMEMRVFLDEAVRRLPHMELVPDQTFSYVSNVAFRGPRQVRVRWEPAQTPERTGTAQSFAIGAPRKNDITRKLIVADVAAETPQVVRLVLRDPHGRPLPEWSPGSHIDLIGGGFRRKYSLCGRPGETWEVAILREAEGRGGSRYFCDQIRLGDELETAGPKNHFRMDTDGTHYVLIAGGIGITPILAMADRLKALGKSYRLHYCGRSQTNLALLDRVVADHGAHLRLHLSVEGSRMNLVRDIGPVTKGDRVYACGPERLLDALQTLSADWPENALHIEHFNAAGSTLDPERAHGFQVELRDSGLTLDIPAGETLLSGLTAAGIDVPCDCNEGLCGTCEVPVIDGAVEHHDKVLSQAERAKGDRMMSCCSRAVKGRRLILGI